MRPITKFVATTILSISSAFAATSQTAIFDVQNMTCSLCPITIKKALERVPGVEDTKIDVAQKTATVKFDPAKANTAALMKATTDAGFPSTVHK
ncbi:MAG: cation transporter [Burkholderiales bacterium]|nr:cation transporter [Pseudomonadota bacterium]